MDRSEEAIAEHADGVRCNACGSVLCVDEPKQAPAPAQRPAASTTRKVSPKMLRYHATRAATRVAMLAAIPGIGTARAVATHVHTHTQHTHTQKKKTRPSTRVPP